MEDVKFFQRLTAAARRSAQALGTPDAKAPAVRSEGSAQVPRPAVCAGFCAQVRVRLAGSPAAQPLWRRVGRDAAARARLPFWPALAVAALAGLPGLAPWQRVEQHAPVKTSLPSGGADPN